MASIDEVIERSREAGEFSERKRFSVARSRAIQKMRQFALADSAYYVLEWIQAAVANGATYLDLAVENEEVRMSYVGGGFAREELEALFDFLFASKDDLEVADVRQLALGVNTLLSAQPEVITIESGDGTLEGTTRVELDGRSDTVSVGTPTRPLEGTYIRASGLRRAWGSLKELRAIEERCLTATIPILVNDSPLFGYSAVRSPDLFGYRRTLKFDEGDLYGTIGIATTPITRNFKLLTWGTWITTQRWEFEGLPPMGGVVGYDRLRKTADHASIVQDEVYQEMWARLLAYARQLAAGQTGKATFDANMLDGPTVTAQDFRKVVREHGRVVVFDRHLVQTEEQRGLAARYGEAFDAPVFLVGPRDRETIQHLGGPDVEVHLPRLDPEELRFFERPVASDPPRPWLTAAVEVDDLAPADVAAQLEEVGGTTAGVAKLARAVRAGTGLDATVYTPSGLMGDGELWVELRVARRVVWCGAIESPFPGHHVVAELGDVDHELLRGKAGAALAVLVAQCVAGRSESALAQATNRVVEALRPGNELSSAARRIVLGVVCRSAIKRLRRGASGVAVRFSLESDALPNVLLELGLLETLDGRVLSFRDLEAMLPTTNGLVFVGDRELSGDYDRAKVIVVDRASERMLTGLLGHQSVVRLGDDTVHASHGQLTCGEFAVGARRYPTFPILVDGMLPTSEEDRSAAIEALAGQLLGAWLDENTSRHVLRHLIWFVVHGEGRVHEQLIEQPLFRTADGRAVSFMALRDRLAGDGVAMYDGWSAEITATTPRADDVRVPLAMDPYVFHMLSRVGRIHPILDVDLTTAEAERNPLTPSIAFLESEEPGMGLEGTIGIPMRRVEDPFVLWLQRKQGTAVALRDLGSDFGVVGRLVGPAALDPTQVTRRCTEACQGMYDRLIRRLPSLATNTEQYLRAVEVMLEYTLRRVRITAGPDGSLGVNVLDPYAQRILDLPVFPTRAGVSVTGWRLLREFTMYGDRNHRPGRAELSEDAPEVVKRWLDTACSPQRIALHPSASPAVGPPSELDRWITAALDELRTDDDTREIEVRVLEPQQYAMWTAQFGIHDPRLFVDDTIVYINRDSWLVRNLGTEQPHPEAASWLLLAVYARINELRLAVTNVHELHFQSRVLDWLDAP